MEPNLFWWFLEIMNYETKPYFKDKSFSMYMTGHANMLSKHISVQLF